MTLAKKTASCCPASSCASSYQDHTLQAFRTSVACLLQEHLQTAAISNNGDPFCPAAIASEHDCPARAPCARVPALVSCALNCAAQPQLDHRFLRTVVPEEADTCVLQKTTTFH
ncbi:unnamed protein product [Polarella glacialis]|uniref:Uncharacterized protein n=1 Tax=Polarella glacialis TaxID=89957 RepID=A0A813DTR4_POLGL|nr:unnamed protein product [Polarella glacialis]